MNPTFRKRNRTLPYNISLFDDDWGSALDLKLEPELEPVREKSRFLLAKWLLLGVAIIFTLSGVAYFASPDRGNALFETCKTIFPPIVTLIIGYYFSEQSKDKST